MPDLFLSRNLVTEWNAVSNGYVLVGLDASRTAACMFLELKNLHLQSTWYLMSAACKSVRTPASRTWISSACLFLIMLHTSKIASFRPLLPWVSPCLQTYAARHRLGFLGSLSVSHFSPQKRQCCRAMNVECSDRLALLGSLLEEHVNFWPLFLKAFWIVFGWQYLSTHLRWTWTVKFFLDYCWSSNSMCIPSPYCLLALIILPTDASERGSFLLHANSFPKKQALSICLRLQGKSYIIKIFYFPLLDSDTSNKNIPANEGAKLEKKSRIIITYS